MPRAFLPHEQALLEGPAYQVHAQLWVEDPDGVFVDLTALAGENWMLGFEHSATIDQPVNPIRVELWREDAAGSLAPLMGGSPLNRNAADAYARLLNVGREFYLRNAITAKGATPAAGDWWEVIRGEVDDLSHGDRESRITLSGRDLGGMLLETRTREEVTFGVDGQLMEDALQLFLDRWYPSVSLYTPVSPGKTIPALTVARDRPVLDVLREVAQGIGYDVRYQWDAATSAFRLTFFLPERDKVTPDLTLGPGLYVGVRSLNLSRRGVRNDFEVSFLNAATGTRETRTRVNPASIAEYGALWMGFTEADDSPVDSFDEADAFLAAADNDVSEPLADQEVECLYYPHIELGDLIEFEPNNIHYDSAQRLAVVGVRHRFYPKERRTWVQTRGRVAGMYREWFRREIEQKKKAESTPPELQYGLLNFREVAASAPGKRRWAWDSRGPYVDSVWWAYDVFPAPWDDDNWSIIAGAVVPLDDAQNYVEVDEPGADEVGALQVEPRLADGSVYAGAEVVERVQVYPIAPQTNGWIDARYEAGVVNVYAGCDPTDSALPVTVEVYEDSEAGTLLASATFSAAGSIGPADDADLGNRLLLANGRRVWWAKFTDRAGNVQWVSDALENPQLPRISKLRQQVGSTSLLTDVFVTVTSPVGRPISLRAWLNKGGTDDANASSSVSGTYTLTFTPGTPGSTEVGPGDTGWSTGTALLDDIAIWPGRGKVIHFEALDDLGFSSGVVDYTLRSWLDVVGADGDLIEDAVWRPAQFAASFAPILRVAALPGSGTRTDERVFNTTDKTLYKWNGSAWVAETPGVGAYSFLPVVIANSISTEELAAFAVTAAKLNVASVFVSGMTLTANSPGAGSVAWSACTVVFEGASYAVAGGNTADEVIWWDRTSPTVFQSSPQEDLVADGYDQNDGDAVIALNEGGSAREAWNGTLIYGGQIVTDAIRARHMEATLSMEVGKVIRSTGYSAGVSGWQIEGDGDAEFNDVVIRGTLDGATGTFSGDLTAPLVNVENQMVVGTVGDSTIWFNDDTIGNPFIDAIGADLYISCTALALQAAQHGFFSATPVSKPTVTGSRGGNAALASLLTALASLGLITDSSS